MTTEQRELAADRIVSKVRAGWPDGPVQLKRDVVAIIGEVLDPKPKRRADVVAEDMLDVVNGLFRLNGLV
jgi:hypothetical protein